MQPLPHCDAPLQQEGADLIDDAGALAHQSLTHPMQGLQIELVGGLGGDELHRRTLHRLRDRFRIAVVILFAFGIRAHVFRRHQPSIVAKRLKLATEMMRADASLHANRQGCKLASRASTWPRDHFCRNTMLPRRSWPTRWNEFLPISMPITAISLLSFWDMACSFVFDAPCQATYALAGREHGRTIPLADIRP